MARSNKLMILIWACATAAVFLFYCGFILSETATKLRGGHSGRPHKFGKHSTPNENPFRSFREVNMISKSASSASSSMMTMPPFMYGTAWKKERTKELVELAIRSGFRGIDTACQPKHYFEPGVGDALQSLYAEGLVSRSDVFIQTKFTSLNGQDPNNVPYDKNAPLADQVRQSFSVSLQNLKTDYLDSLVLHSPMPTYPATQEVWKVMEELHQSGRVRQLGLSNTYHLPTLQALYNDARVKPSILQNRFYDQSGYDIEIRKFCKEKGIKYQSFWTLTANPRIIKSREVRRLAEKYQKTPEQIFFMFVQSQGIVPLTGTSSVAHMKQDLDTLSAVLEVEDAAIIEAML